MLRTMVLALWLGCFIAIFATPYSGLFSILTALSTVALFFFPIRYANRDAVQQTARLPLTWLTSPFPYVLIAVVVLLAFMLSPG